MNLPFSSNVRTLSTLAFNLLISSHQTLNYRLLLISISMLSIFYALVTSSSNTSSYWCKWRWRRSWVWVSLSTDTDLLVHLHLLYSISKSPSYVSFRLTRRSGSREIWCVQVLSWRRFYLLLLLHIRFICLYRILLISFLLPIPTITKRHLNFDKTSNRPWQWQNGYVRPSAAVYNIVWLWLMRKTLSLKNSNPSSQWYEALVLASLEFFPRRLHGFIRKSKFVSLLLSLSPSSLSIVQMGNYLSKYSSQSTSELSNRPQMLFAFTVPVLRSLP